MATMNVSLPTEMVEFVEHEVSKGGYGSSSEVVREALRLLRHEKSQQAEKLAILRREVRIGLDAASVGRFSKKRVGEILEEVMLDTREG
jgi:antitoxin ParD1/3/4